MDTVISVNQLSVSYHDHPALRGISFKIEPNSGLVGIVGPNGAGKSTLLKAMLGLVPKDGGEVRFFGGNWRAHRRDIAYMPQRSAIDWDFPISVMDTVLLGTYPHLRLFRRPGKGERAWAEACLEQVGMANLADRQISRLSGGQQQRVFVARVLAQRPKLLLLDEPFAGIDVQSEETILRILHDLRDQGITSLVVHHDLDKVRQHFDRALLINRGLFGFGPVDDVLAVDRVVSAFSPRVTTLTQLGVGA